MFSCFYIFSLPSLIRIQNSPYFVGRVGQVTRERSSKSPGSRVKKAWESSASRRVKPIWDENRLFFQSTLWGSVYYLSVSISFNALGFLGEHLRGSESIIRLRGRNRSAVVRIDAGSIMIMTKQVHCLRCYIILCRGQWLVMNRTNWGCIFYSVLYRSARV